MQVKNNAPFPIVAVCSFSSFGEGEHELIQPNESKQVLGPPISKIEGRVCYSVVTGEIVCHNNPDNHGCYRITEGHPLRIKRGDACIIILHHSDKAHHAAKQFPCDGDQK